MSKRKALLRKALILLISLAFVAALAVGFLAWFVGAFSGTNVAFQSSDGEWADSEMMFKGRDFGSIQRGFEAYRNNCSATSVLQRTTPKPKWHTLDHWFNDYNSPKWQVPFAPALPNAVSGYYPPIHIRHCENKDSPLGPNNSFKPTPRRGAA